MSDCNNLPGWVQELHRRKTAEKGPWFLDAPERWLDAHTYRCENEHVSTRVLSSEERGYLCLACQKPVHLTFPEDMDGPLHFDEIGTHKNEG